MLYLSIEDKIMKIMIYFCFTDLRDKINPLAHTAFIAEISGLGAIWSKLEAVGRLE